MENQNETVLEGEYIPAGEPATFEEWLNKSSVVHPAQNLGQHAGHKFYKQEIYYGQAMAAQTNPHRNCTQPNPYGPTFSNGLLNNIFGFKIF